MRNELQHDWKEGSAVVGLCTKSVEHREGSSYIHLQNQESLTDKGTFGVGSSKVHKILADRKGREENSGVGIRNLPANTNQNNNKASCFIHKTD